MPGWAGVAATTMIVAGCPPYRAWSTIFTSLVRPAPTTLVTHPVSARPERRDWPGCLPGRIRPVEECASTLTAWVANVCGWYLVPLWVTVNVGPPRAGTLRFGRASALRAALCAGPAAALGAAEDEVEVDG